MTKILKEIANNHGRITITRSWDGNSLDVQLDFGPNAVFYVVVKNEAELKREYKKVLKELDLIFD